MRFRDDDLSTGGGRRFIHVRACLGMHAFRIPFCYFFVEKQLGSVYCRDVTVFDFILPAVLTHGAFRFT